MGWAVLVGMTVAVLAVAWAVLTHQRLLVLRVQAGRAAVARDELRRGETDDSDTSPPTRDAADAPPDGSRTTGGTEPDPRLLGAERRWRAATARYEATRRRFPDRLVAAAAGFGPLLPQPDGGDGTELGPPASA